jgi:hypothetical protein
MFVRMTAMSMTVGLAALLAGQPARAADDVGASGHGSSEQAPAAAPLGGFVSGIERRQRGLQDRIMRLAEPLLKEIQKRGSDDTGAAGQASMVEAAKAKLKGATLARECAEIELQGYIAVIFPQERATALQEVTLAEEDLKRAHSSLDKADERFDKIKRLLKGSALDLDLEYRFEAGQLIAKLGEKKAQFALEQTRSNLKVLSDYTKDKRVKELRAKIEWSRAEELMAKATAELEDSKLKRLSRPQRGLSAAQKSELGLLDRAIAIDAAIRGKLSQLTKNGKADAALQKEITDSTNERQALIDRAEAEHAAAQTDALKAALGQAARGRP